MLQSNLTIASSLFIDKIRQSDGTIDLSQLKQIPGGGTHDIYQIKSDEPPSFLLKVIQNSIGKEETVLAEQLKKLTKQYTTLYSIFDVQRCLVETRSIQNLVINNVPTTQKAIVSVVPFDTCFRSEEKFGFNAEPLEIDEVTIKKNLELYTEMNLSLLGNEESFASFNINDYLIFHKACQPIFALLEKDADLQKVMREFLSKFQKFYSETNMFMDFIGRDNVLFYKNTEGWQFKLGSVIKHDTKSLTIDSLNEIAYNPSVIKNSFEKTTAIFFIPSCIRLLNAVAKKLNMNKIVTDIPFSVEDSDHLSTMYQQLKHSTRAVTYAEHDDFETALYYFHLHEQSDEKHDTYVRDILGTRYWQFIKDSKIERPIAEIKIFLSILCDEKNQFPPARQDLVNTAVQGLQAKLDNQDDSIAAKLVGKNTFGTFFPSSPVSADYVIPELTELQKSLLDGFIGFRK